MLSFDLADLISNNEGELDIDRLREAAGDRTHEDADSAVIYYSRALDIVSEYPNHEPDASEVREFVSGNDAGDWRKVMTACAYLTARSVLEESANEALDRLKDAVEWAEGEGFTVDRFHTSCVYGWAPHAWERDEDGGVLHYWPKLEGGSDRYLLHLTDDGVWVELSKDEDTEE